MVENVKSTHFNSWHFQTSFSQTVQPRNERVLGQQRLLVAQCFILRFRRHSYAITLKKYDGMLAVQKHKKNTKRTAFTLSA